MLVHMCRLSQPALKVLICKIVGNFDLVIDELVE